MIFFPSTTSSNSPQIDTQSNDHLNNPIAYSTCLSPQFFNLNFNPKQKKALTISLKNSTLIAHNFFLRGKIKQKLYVILAIIFLISCGIKENTVKIAFWAHGGSPNMNNFAKQRLIEFNQIHPNIKAIYSQKSWNMIRELLYTNFGQALVLTS